jgi:hypothetical protein
MMPHRPGGTLRLSHGIAFSVLSLAACFVTLPAQALDAPWAAGVTGGTLGVGPELSFRPNANVGVRLNAGFLGVSRDEEIDDIDYDGDVDLNSFGALLDWYPTSGGWRVSIGGRINNTEIGIVGRPTTSVTVGGTTYTPQQIGTLSGTVTTDDFAPQLTMGYGGTLAKGFTLGAEIGVLWQGQPQIDNLRGTGLLAGTPQLQADIEREEREIENEMDDYELWPILQVEFLYRF